MIRGIGLPLSVRVPLIAAAMMVLVGVVASQQVMATLGTLSSDGAASKAVMTRPSATLFLWSVNQAGVGLMIHGARITDFCGWSSNSPLWTTPWPDWMSVSGWPGKAPQVALTMP